jgi:hypothetical protein
MSAFARAPASRYGVAAPAAAGRARIVTVPLSDQPVVPVTRARVRRLRMHLVETLRALRTLPDAERAATPARPEPDGLGGAVARTACGLCRGVCCKGGGDHAYLDEGTLARVRRARPELEAGAVIALYVGQVAGSVHRDSCVFHGANGCTLDRALRSDVCNSYFCPPLGQFVDHPRAPDGVVVIAREGHVQRRAPVLRQQP